MKTRITMTTEIKGKQFETTHIVVSDAKRNPPRHHVRCVTTNGGGSTLRSFPRAVERAGEQHDEYVRNAQETRT